MRRIKTLVLGLALGLAFTVTMVSRAQNAKAPEATAHANQPAACCSHDASCCQGGGSGSCCSHGACKMRASH